MEDITPLEAQQRLERGALLVDVREQNEFDEVRAVGAQLLPLSEFEARFGELPQDRDLLMICRSGARSARAAQHLLDHGYRATNVAGGTLAWVEADLPHAKGQPGGGAA